MSKLRASDPVNIEVPVSGQTAKISANGILVMTLVAADKPAETSVSFEGWVNQVAGRLKLGLERSLPDDSVHGL